MSDTNLDPVRELLVDSFSRVKDLVEGLTHRLSPELATWRADDEADEEARTEWAI